MVVHERTIDIAASPETVYDVIVDFAAYRDWNPWIDDARPVAGRPDHLEVDAVLGDRRMKVVHRILERIPGRAFTWSDTGWFTAFAYGERARTLEPTPDGRCRYHVTLRITGPFAWLAGRLYGPALETGLTAETEALRARAEARGA